MKVLARIPLFRSVAAWAGLTPVRLDSGRQIGFVTTVEEVDGSLTMEMEITDEAMREVLLRGSTRGVSIGDLS